MWVLQNGQPTSLGVTVGQTNGQVTEVSGAELRAGQMVIVGTKSIQP